MNDELLGPHLPPVNKPMTINLSTPEWRWIQINVITGKYGSNAECVRHIFRKGLVAEGLFREAMECL